MNFFQKIEVLEEVMEEKSLVKFVEPFIEDAVIIFPTKRYSSYYDDLKVYGETILKELEPSSNGSLWKLSCSSYDFNIYQVGWKRESITSQQFVWKNLIEKFKNEVWNPPSHLEKVIEQTFGVAEYMRTIFNKKEVYQYRLKFCEANNRKSLDDKKSNLYSGWDVNQLGDPNNMRSTYVINVEGFVSPMTVEPYDMPKVVHLLPPSSPLVWIILDRHNQSYITRRLKSYDNTLCRSPLLHNKYAIGNEVLVDYGIKFIVQLPGEYMVLAAGTAYQIASQGPTLYEENNFYLKNYAFAAIQRERCFCLKKAFENTTDHELVFLQTLDLEIRAIEAIQGTLPSKWIIEYKHRKTIKGDDTSNLVDTYILDDSEDEASNDEVDTTNNDNDGIDDGPMITNQDDDYESSDGSHIVVVPQLQPPIKRVQKKKQPVGKTITPPSTPTRWPKKPNFKKTKGEPRKRKPDTIPSDSTTKRAKVIPTNKHSPSPIKVSTPFAASDTSTISNDISVVVSSKAQIKKISQKLDKKIQDHNRYEKMAKEEKKSRSEKVKNRYENRKRECKSYLAIFFKKQIRYAQSRIDTRKKAIENWSEASGKTLDELYEEKQKQELFMEHLKARRELFNILKSLYCMDKKVLEELYICGFDAEDIIRCFFSTTCKNNEELLKKAVKTVAPDRVEWYLNLFKDQETWDKYFGVMEGIRVPWKDWQYQLDNLKKYDELFQKWKHTCTQYVTPAIQSLYTDKNDPMMNKKPDEHEDKSNDSLNTLIEVEEKEELEENLDDSFNEKDDVFENSNEESEMNTNEPFDNKNECGVNETIEAMEDFIEKVFTSHGYIRPKNSSFQELQIDNAIVVDEKRIEKVQNVWLPSSKFSNFIIEDYFKILQEKSLKLGSRQHIAIILSQVFEFGYLTIQTEDLKNQTATNTIEACTNLRYIFTPILQNGHWYLFICDFVKNCWYTYDSIFASKFEPPKNPKLKKRIGTMKNIIMKALPQIDFTSWTTLPPHNLNFPLQNDSHSCGVYICNFARQLAQGRSIIEISNSQLYREIIIAELLKAKRL